MFAVLKRLCYNLSETYNGYQNIDDSWSPLNALHSIHNGAGRNDIYIVRKTYFVRSERPVKDFLLRDRDRSENVGRKL